LAHRDGSHIVCDAGESLNHADVDLPLMKTRFLATLFACTLALVAGAAESSTKLDGTWQPTQAELGGQSMPSALLASITLTLRGGSYEVVVVTAKGRSPDKGTVVYDETTKPKGMTITGVEGPNAGKTFPAIYELEGDTLRICYDLSGAGRPDEFKSPPRTKLYLVTYHRSK
jgi:uncharacterized protein (TIGR03067 family)